jgi:phage FluMu protein Com
MKILGAVLLTLVVSVGCGGQKGAGAGGAQGPEAPADAEAPPQASSPDAAAAAAPAAAPDAAVAAADAKKPPEGGGTATASMNLKVLPATWSKDQVKGYMKKVSAALGVKCDHCHDVNNFAADTEHKTIARGMMKMTDELNKQYFKGEPRLGCITCHNGEHTPKK